MIDDSFVYIVATYWSITLYCISSVLYRIEAKLERKP